MLKLRVITVAILLPVFVAAAFWLPNMWWGALLLGITLLGAGEWARLAGNGRAVTAAFYALIIAGCAIGFLSAQSNNWIYAVSTIFWVVAVPLALWRKPAPHHRLATTAAGCIVLVPLWLALLRLQGEPGLMLALLAVVWISDSAAYGAGHAWGRHKLAPFISPGKTWEGVSGAFAAVAVYAAVFHFWWFPEIGLSFVLMSFFVITALGILGDLLESLLKRNAGVKDSGTLLPGHGGVLDRIDALTAAMPFAALMFARP